MIDSFPLAACKFGRIRYYRSFRGYGADYAKCSSKKETYFGYKVRSMITSKGYFTAFEITPASTDDLKGLRNMIEEQSGFDIVNISWHMFLKDITDYATSSKAS